MATVVLCGEWIATAPAGGAAEPAAATLAATTPAPASAPASPPAPGPAPVPAGSPALAKNRLQTPTDMLLAEGLSALEEGRYSVALRPLHQCIAATGESAARPEIRFWAAEAALRAGQPDYALALLGGLFVPLAPIADALHARRAEALLALDRPTEAAAAWQAILRDWARGPFAKQAAFGLGHALLASHYGQGGAQALRRAIARYPTAAQAPAARLALADLLAAQKGSAFAVTSWRALTVDGDAQVAAEAARRLQRLANLQLLPPPTAAERLHAIDAALRRRHLDEAQAAIAAALAALPDPAGATSTVAPAADLAAPTAGAVRTSPATALDRARLQLRQAQLWRRRHDFAAAQILLAALVENGPLPIRHAALREWASLALAGDHPADAAPLYLRLAQQSRGTARREATFEAAVAHYVAGDDGKAAQAFARYVAAYPHDRRADEACWFAAWAAFRGGALEQADAHLRHLLRAWPHGSLVGRAHYWRGRIATLRGRSSQAQPHYRRALADVTGYYALLARHALANAGGAASSSQSPPPCAVPEAATPTPAEANTNINAPEPDQAVAWQAPMGQRTAWFYRLGLHRQAAMAAPLLPAAPHAEASAHGLARAQLLLALGDYHGAMVAGSALLGKLQGWPQTEATALHCAVLPLAYPPAYASWVAAAANDFLVSPALVLAIMRQESAFLPLAQSTSAAHGLMQIMPQTGRAIAQQLAEAAGDDEALLQPQRNVRYGAWYLAALLRNYGGNVALAIGAYNAGPVAMDGWLARFGPQPLDVFVENVPFKETRQYIKRVLRNLEAYGQLQGAPPLTLASHAAPTSAHVVDF